MDFSIGNLNGTNANISSMISQLIAKKTSSMNSLLDQRASIENALATLQNSSLGIGSINNSYSSQIASLQDSIDAMKEQYTINANKLNTINSLNNSYNKTVSTLDDYIQSLKNPNPNDSLVSGSSSNGNVAGVDVDNSANPQRIELSVSQLATCSVLKSGIISGTSITGNTKITDLFAGNYDSASNTISSLRTDISESMKLSELGVKSGSFKLGSRVITVKSDETVGDLINKINADSNYTAKIDRATGAFTISAKSGSSVAITNAVGDLNVSGNLSTTTKLEDLGIKSGAYFVGGVQIDVADGDTVGVLIDKLEAEGFNASIQTDTNNPSSKVLSITDSNGNKVSTEGTNFASAAGFTVSEGTFSINGETFTIGSDTTIDDLLYQINKATDDGVGAIFKDGQIVLTASKTGAVEINVEKGSSNFTNAVGFTTGGVMNTGNLVMGSDGSYVTLKGLNSGIKGSDIAKADGSGKFTSGNFLISYSKIDDLGNATNEMLTTEIVVEDGDTINDIIQKIKNQTTQKYTDSEGVERTNYLQAEIVDGHFQIRQTAKGADFDIAVQAGSSTFTSYVGLTKDVGTGVSTSGSATTYTGVNAVTDSTTFTEGSFKITASLANNPNKTETVTIEVGANETLQSVMDKINNSGLAIRAQLVTASDGTQRLQLAHNNYGSGYQISVEAGDTNFTNVVGFTTSVSTGVSNDGSSSTLTGIVTGLDKNTTGYKDGSFVISTNKLSSDGKTASSEMASAIIEVDSSMSLQDIMDKINSATYKDASGNDVDLGLRASLTSDGRIQISQIHGGEGFDIKVEAGDTNFTQEVGLTKDVTVGVSTGSTSSYIMGTKTYNGTFTEGSFKITTNKVGADGSASSEMISVDVNIEAGKTLAQQLDSINAQLNSIGLSASVIADGADAGKIKIEQLNSGAGFDIKIEAGSTDFTEKLGLTTQVSTGVSNDGTFAYVLGKNDLSNTAGYTAGDFTVTTNKTDAEGNPLDEMQSVTVKLQAGLSAQEAVNSINSQLASIGLSATIEDGKIKISQTNAGAGFDIKIEGGSTNFTEKAGLTKDVSVGTSTDGTATKIVGNKNVTSSQKGFSEGSFTITSGKTGEGATVTIDISANDTIQSVINKINSSGIDVSAYIDDNGKFVIQQNNAGPDYFITVEAGNTDFTQVVGITANVTTGVSNEAQNATLTGTIGNLNPGMTFTEGEFVITTNDVTHGTQEGYFADPNKFLSTTISVAKGDTLQDVIDKINQQGASIGISASLTSDGKIQLSQLNGGSGFTISVTAGSTNFTEKVGLTAAVSAGESTNGSYTNITGTNNVSGTDTAGVGHIDRDTAIAMGYTVVSMADELVNALKSGADKIMLTGNIDMSGVDYTPDSSNAFSGVFDGNGYYISNLKVNSTVGGGLFGGLDGAVVRNIGFVNADIKAAGAVGVLAAVASNSTISNVYVKDSSVASTAGSVSALVAFTSGDVSINNVVVENTTIFGNNSDQGGLVARVVDGNLSISNSAVDDILFTYTPSGNRPVGGFIGIVFQGNVSVSNSIANFVSSNTSQAGSIAGVVLEPGIVSFNVSNVVSMSNLNPVVNDYSGNSYTGAVEEVGYNDFASVTTDLSGIEIVKDDSSSSGYRISNTILENTLGESDGSDSKFTTGNFKITAGTSGNEITAEITVEDGDTIDDIINKINSAGLGVTASITADGKFTITSNSADPDFRIKVESGSSDFLAYVGMASAVQNTGILTSGSDANQYTTLTGSANLTNGNEAITSGSFKINGVTIEVSGTIENALNQINNYTSQTGVVAELVQNDSGSYNVVLRAAKTGSGTSIYVEGGTSDFGVVAGLTTQSVGGGAALGTEGVKQTITGSKDVVHQLTEAEATAQGYTVIHNASEFASKINANKSGKFMLMGDIDLSSVSYTAISGFSGTLDGNGYTIEGLSGSSGLFETTSAGATIKNLNIENFVLNNTGNTQTGILIDNAIGALTVENINVSNASVTGTTVGLIGSSLNTSMHTPLNVNNIFIDSNVKFNGDGAGSVIGSSVAADLNFSNIEIHAQIEAEKVLGGIVGSFSTGIIEFDNILFDGDLYSSNTSVQAGALFGKVLDEDMQNRLHNIYLSPTTHDMSNPLVSMDSSVIKASVFGNSVEYHNFEVINFYFDSDSIEYDDLINANHLSGINGQSFEQITSNRQFYASPYTQISAGTVKVNGTTITLTAGTIDEAIAQINAKSSQTGVTAAIKDGRVVFMSDSAFTVAEGTSDFVQKTGTAGYTINSVTSSTRGDVVTGTQDLNKISAEEAEDLGYTVVTTKSELISALQANENIMLMNDIDMSGSSNNFNYSGILNGNGYTIKNLTSTLLGTAYNGTIIKNLKIDGANVGGSAIDSILVTEAYGSVTFENIEVTNSEINGGGAPYQSGVLVGLATNGSSLTFRNIKIADSVSISGASNIGGLAGTLDNADALVQNVQVSAHIDGDNYLGGIFGSVSGNVTFDNVVSNGSIFSDAQISNQFAGGFVGYTSNANTKLTFMDSYADVDMQMDEVWVENSGTNMTLWASNPLYINQFVGYLYQGSTSFKNSYYLSSNAFTAKGELGTATATEKTIDSFDENWSSRKVSLTEDEAVALGYTVIHNANEFRSKIASDLDGKFMLVGDIDLSTVSYSTLYNFKGTLDGNGYTIKNFTSSTAYGLFSATQDGATFKNLTLDNINLSVSSSSDTGLLIGMATGDFTIDNIVVKNSSVNAHSAGGLIGGISYTASIPVIGTINNIYIDKSVEINGGAAAGGVVSSAAYTGRNAAGSHLYISNVSSYAKVSTTSAGGDGRYGAGGIVGSTSMNLDIVNVRVGGSVSGAKYAGGILGSFYKGTNTNTAEINISQAFFTGSLSTASGTSGGGIVGMQSGDITNSSYVEVNVSSSYYSNSSYTDRFGATYASNTATLAKDREFFSSQYLTYWTKNPNTDPGDWGLGPSILANANGISINGTNISLANGDNINTVISKINEQSSTTGVTAELVDGYIQFYSDEKFSLKSPSNATSPAGSFVTSDFMKQLGVTGDMYGVNVLTSSVSGLNRDTVLDGLSAGTLNLQSQHGEKADVTIGASDTLGDIIDKINKTDYFRAGLDSEGRFYIEDLKPYDNNNAMVIGSGPIKYVFNVDNSDTNFENLLGLGSYSTTYEDKSQSSIFTTLKGSSSVTGNETLDAGTFTLMLGDKSQNFTVNQGETINSVLDKINASSIGISAYIENNKIVLITDEQTPDNIALKEVSGNFGTVSGLTTITNYGGESVVGHEGSYTTLKGSNTVAAGISKAEAEAKGYIAVSTAQELRNAMLNSSTSKTIVLMNDIDMSGFGTSISSFAGTIDGNGYTLKNYTNTDGLIKTTKGSVTIKNLNIDNFNISGSSSSDYHSLLIDNTSYTVTVDSVNITNSQVNGLQHSGALIGYSSRTVSINNVSIDENTLIKASSHYGGALIGSMSGLILSINNVYSAAEIDCWDEAGGLVGYATSTLKSLTVKDVFIEGTINVSSTSGYSGGLVGRFASNSVSDDISNVIINSDFLVAHEDADSATGSFHANILSNASLSGEYIFYNSDKTPSVVNTDGAQAISTVGSKTGYDKNTFVSNKFTQVSAGTIQINGQNIILSGGNIGTAINEINEYSSKTGVTASVEDGKVVFKNTQYGSNGISITAGTSDFVEVTGTAGYAISAPTTTVEGGRVTGTAGIDTSTRYTAEEAQAMGYTVVKTGQQLLDALVANKDKIMLMNNITMSSAAVIENFDGILDGNGYTISGMNNMLINSTEDGAVIKNLKIVGANVSNNAMYTGFLVGQAKGSITFENIEITNSALTGTTMVGALVGRVASKSVFLADNIYIGDDVTITGGQQVGGLAGIVLSNTKSVVTNVTAAAQIQASSYLGLGGIIGYAYSDATFENVKSEGSINTTYTGSGTLYMGGFIGYLSSTKQNNIIFKDTYAKVKMTKGLASPSNSATVNQYVGYNNNLSNTIYNVDNAKFYRGGAYGGTDSMEIGTATTSSTVPSDIGFDDNWTVKSVILSETKAAAQGYTVIHNAQEFVDKIKADLDGKFILMGNIDFRNVSYTSISGFSGTLNGNGYTIKNLSAENGLFATTEDGADIKNLTLDGFTIAGATTAGALIGTANGSANIENILLKNTYFDVSYMGGLVGTFSAENSVLNINNVYVDSSVTAEDTLQAGGILGTSAYDSSTVIIRNAESYATLSTLFVVGAGGIACAISSDAVITNVRTGGSLSGFGSGGIVAAVDTSVDANGDVFISKAYTSAQITGSTNDGSPAEAIVGHNDTSDGGTLTVKDSYYSNNSYSNDNGGTYSASASSQKFYQAAYTQVSSGTISINGVSVRLEEGSIASAIGTINEYSDQTGVKAYINSSNRIVFDAIEGSGQGVTITKGTSDFYSKAVNSFNSSLSHSITKTTGSVKLTEDIKLDGLSDGSITIDGKTIKYTSNMTVGQVIDLINEAATSLNGTPIAGHYFAAAFTAGLDEQGRFFIKTDGDISFTGNLAKFIGFESGVVSSGPELVLGYDEKFSTLTGTKNVNVNSDVSSGDFYINYNGKSQKFTVGDNETIQSVMDKITNSSLGVTATIQNGKIVITANEANSERIYITDGTSNFSELAGFTSEGAQSGTTVQGADSVYMSSNTALSAQGTYSDGDFYVHLTDTDGNITDTARIEIAASDSIQDIINKINDSGLGVTAYIDETTGRLAIKRDSSTQAGGVLVTKGTSDFTNKIGFTSGGEQNVVTNAGSQAELVSQNTATNAKFSDGNFIIQITDKDGNVTSEHVFEVSSGDSAQKIAQMITDAGIGLTAYIDNTTDKMVIKRNTDSGEGGFIIQKGTSDFTTVMNFTSGGYEIGVKEDGETASITSLYNVSSAGNFTAGTFYIDGTEITITEADLKSANKIQTILDRITELTDVVATLDNQNRIVLTKKSSAGEGEIEIVKGTSDFTSKFGFTSGGYQNAIVTDGTTATITSGVTSYNTKVSAGDFYLQLTGDNATDPIKITVDEGDTVGTIIDKINAMDIGVAASWDSSANKIVITRDAETGEGGINVIKGTSDFTNLVGFTSGGQQDPATVNGNTASITSNNQVGPDTAITKGDFIIRFNGTDHVIELTKDTTIDEVIDKINQIDGLTAAYDDTTKKITITRDGDSGEGNFEIIKGTSNFTTVAGFTSGGTQSSSAIRGSKASITSTNSINDSQKFTQGDFTINLTGENAASIKINVDTNDTIISIVDKINALNAGVTARYDNTTGLITISRDAETGDGSIEIVKGSSNFTNVVGFTQGGSSSASFNDGEYAEITAQKSAAANQHFGAGDFTIRLTGDNASSITIDVTADDTMQSIINKINAADAGVTAYLNDDNKLVIKRDADTGVGGIEIVKGSSSFTTDIGLTTGGDEYSGIHDAGESAKIVSTQDVSTAQGSYTSGNFFIQMLDKDGNPEAGGLIQIDINKSGNTVDDINTIINNINAKNAGITASIENGKLVLTRDESLDAGSFVVLKGTSDFTNVIGLTAGGSLQDGVYEAGNAATHTVLTSQDLGKKLVSDSMTLGSIGVKTGTFRINGVDINVKSSDTIYDLVSRINSVFSDPKYEGIAVTASYENGEMVLRSKEASSTARVTVERGTSNFTDIANFTNSYQNSSDLGILEEGHNAHFTINGKEYDMALDLKDITDDNVYNGNNLIYLDADGNVVTSADDASITIEVKQTGSTTIDIGRNLLNDSVEKLQSFVNRFNTAMDAAANPIMSDDTEFAAFINQIKSALTSNIGSMNKITQKLAEIGIIVKVTGGTNSNMGTVEMSLSKTNGKYDYVEAFYDDPQKVMDLIIGDDSNPLDYSVAGAFTRLSDTIHYALENNRGGYFKVTPRSLEAQQKALKREITKTTFDLNELKNTAAGDNGMQGLSEYLLQLEQQYQLINEAIIALNKQYSSSITRLVLNKNNSAFNPIVS